MGQLVGQLLELARAENVKPRMEELDLSRLVAGGVLPFESVAFEKGLGLDTRIPDGIRITGSSSQLSQLVSILVDNAISHGESDSKVQVSLTHTRSAAVLSVRNAGSPIPQEQLERLFERFYRADESRSGEEKHYGLGLSIAKAIVQAHSGKIEVLCRDGFVEFRVSLPKTPTCPERRKQ
jgi:signal transduction histidine kinase